MAETIKDLRKAKRIQIDIPVRLIKQPEPEPGVSFFISSLTELSRDGAFVRTSVGYSQGSMVSLDFEIPDDHSELCKVHALGRISWEGNPKTATPTHLKGQSLPMGVGIQFVLMTQDEKKLIDDFVEIERQRKIPQA